MGHDAHMKTFNAIVEEVLHIPHAEIRDDLTSNDVPDWDSMNYVFFIAELEKEFGISFSMDDVLRATCLGDLRAIVETRTKK